VLTVKLADEAPAATVTLDGTLAALLLLARATAVAVCTFALNVTVPVELLPPVMVLGFKLKDEIVAGGGVPVEFISTYKAVRTGSRIHLSTIASPTSPSA
jgi:hypothetical protein